MTSLEQYIQDLTNGCAYLDALVSIKTTEIEKPDFLYIRSVNNLDTVKINYHINNHSDITDIKVYKRNNYGSFYHHKTVPFDSSYLYINDYNILDIGYYYYLSPV